MIWVCLDNQQIIFLLSLNFLNYLRSFMILFWIVIVYSTDLNEFVNAEVFVFDEV